MRERLSRPDASHHKQKTGAAAIFFTNRPALGKTTIATSTLRGYTMPRTSDDDDDRPRRRRPRDDDDDDRPRKRRPRADEDLEDDRPRASRRAYDEDDDNSARRRRRKSRPVKKELNVV